MFVSSTFLLPMSEIWLWLWNLIQFLRTFSRDPNLEVGHG
jgi:hypothetical protein